MISFTTSSLCDEVARIKRATFDYDCLLFAAAADSYFSSTKSDTIEIMK